MRTGGGKEKDKSWRNRGSAGTPPRRRLARRANVRPVAAPKDACPCGSARSYAACCEPFHRGVREAPDAETLMRSRFSAFAKRELEYLWHTLHPDHEDRRADRGALVAALRTAANAHRYVALTICDREEPDGAGIARVQFAARVFENKLPRGADRSFVELSEFTHDGEGWRYLAGETRPWSAFRGDVATLTIAAFRAGAG